ncbi:esterase-like activity of phytase family protein [Amycolatopsis sp. FDAARGOS 1241]|uniref:esterase-like activity of phytase family protein n=1 Tax=Amycolatopsis sp. FDAARGOS 1241 TaxID=2778070 RepID=UPI0019520C1B|nr:esterase-like activity of phytase family protein [Amycolatopsis sp. FDAARGOS 1241]QRP42753.1 esterase-like activity of phytase family protein [Amycolatopsis sp. FDAARGOS 1241]
MGAADGPGTGPRCSPQVSALGFSDALDKRVVNGAEVGGLSSLAFDVRSHSWSSTVDNHASDPARIWFFRNLGDPTPVGGPLVLRKPDGTPYTGTDSDNERLAVLPDGDYVVSSEIEPSIRIFGRDGVQKVSMPVPARFAVTGTTPDGEATSNATFEGLTISPSGREIIASMEDALSGDVSASGDASLHRFLVYTDDGTGHWHLTKQVGYRAEPGMRIPEVAAYRDDAILVEEAAFDSTAGNSVDLFTVTGLRKAADVSAVPNLSDAPRADVVAKQHLADLVNCPTLGAPAKEAQANPLLDNYEGMAVTGTGPGLTGVSLISDDNFSAMQTTRVLNLAAHLP